MFDGGVFQPACKRERRCLEVVGLAYQAGGTRHAAHSFSGSASHEGLGRLPAIVV